MTNPAWGLETSHGNLLEGSEATYEALIMKMMMMNIALVHGNKALPCPVCMTNLAWGLESSHGN
jgi:hypothetical protein